MRFGSTLRDMLFRKDLPHDRLCDLAGALTDPPELVRARITVGCAIMFFIVGATGRACPVHGWGSLVLFNAPAHGIACKWMGRCHEVVSAVMTESSEAEVVGLQVVVEVPTRGECVNATW